MTHQAHNIPWNTLASHLKFIRENARYTPHRTDLYSREKPTTEKDVQYFARCLAKTIKDFSATERAKFPGGTKNNKPMPKHGRKSGRLYSAEILNRNLPWMLDERIGIARDHYYETGIVPPEGETPLTRLLDIPREARKWTPGGREPADRASSGSSTDIRDAELLENWIKWVAPGGWSRHDHAYNEVVAMLLSEGEMAPLLELARHPDVAINDLPSGNYQYHYSQLIETTLQAYLVYNLAFCFPELWAPKTASNEEESSKNTTTFNTNAASDAFTTVPRRQWNETYSAWSTIRHMVDDTAGNLICLPHRRFIGMDKMLRMASWRLPYLSLKPKIEDIFDPLADIEALHEYLKECFRVLVRYDVLREELKRPKDWEFAITRQLNKLYKLPHTPRE